MTSTFIAAWRHEVKTAAVEKLAVEAAETDGKTGQRPTDDEPKVRREEW